MKYSLTLLLALALGMMACNSSENPSSEGEPAAQETGAPKEAAQSENTEQAAEQPQPVAYQFPNVEGKLWNLYEYEYARRTAEPFKESRVFIVIKGEEITGNTGCNTITGKVNLRQDGTMSVGPLATTKMLCQGKMTQESRIVELLEGAQSYSVNKIFLEVSSTKGKLSFQNN